MPEWIAKVRVTEVREVIVESNTKEEAEAAAERREGYEGLVEPAVVGWEVLDVGPYE